MALSSSDVNRWLGTPRESENLEFKEAKNGIDTTKLFKYCVALANEGGGHLVLGATDKHPRRVVGTTAFPSVATIAEKILNKLRFRVVVEEFMHPDGRLVVFDVPSRPLGTAFTYEGAYLMRSGENLVPMTEDRLRTIFSEGRPNWLGDVAIADCTAAEVVRILDTQAYFDLLGLPYPTARRGALERFESEQLIKKVDDRWNILNLGAILFAKNLDAIATVRRKCPRLIVYDGNDKLFTRFDRTLTEGYAVGFERWITLIDSLIPANEVIQEALRTELKMFPQPAVRELLPNALIHQDFTVPGTSVRIELYSDRIEITNPGQPPIPIERFIDEYKSRNEVLADLMRRMGVCEEKGSGIDRVISQAEIFQLPAPDFRQGDVHTKVILFGHKAFEEMDRDARIRACYQHCCLKYVMVEKMTNQSLRERFDLPSKKSETVSRIIGDALAEGHIKLSDPSTRSTRYRSYIPFWA